MIKIKMIDKIIDFFKKDIELETAVIRPALDDKSSRIWGADEEFTYERAAELLGSSIPQPSKLRNYTNYAREYGNNVWVYAAVYQIAVSIASVPFGLYKRKYRKSLSKDPVVDIRHPLLKVFSKPNPFMSLFDLLEAVIAGLELTGNSYLEEVYDDNKNLIELYPLQPHKIEIIPDRKKLVKGYMYYGSQGAVSFDVEEIAHIKYYNPTSDFYGMSPHSPAEKSVMTSNYATDWNKNFFENSAIPASVLETEQNLNDSLVKRLKNEWKKVHKGISKAHDIAILEGGLKYRAITMNQKDMDFVNMKDKNRDEILVAWGVPPAILGIIDNVNNSVLENLKKMFWENTLLPKMEKLEFAFNSKIIWPFDETIYAAFDKDAIEALKGS